MYTLRYRIIHMVTALVRLTASELDVNLSKEYLVRSTAEQSTHQNRFTKQTWDVGFAPQR